MITQPLSAKERNQIENSYLIYFGHFKLNSAFLLTDVNKLFTKEIVYVGFLKYYCYVFMEIDVQMSRKLVSFFHIRSFMHLQDTINEGDKIIRSK